MIFPNQALHLKNLQHVSEIFTFQWYTSNNNIQDLQVSPHQPSEMLNMLNESWL